MSKFTKKYRVYYEDTDAGGVVYYANFLKFAERARTDFLRESGYDHRRLMEEKNVFFVVKKAEVDYQNPGRLDDEILVETIITKIGASSVEMTQNCFNHHGDKLADVKILIVCVTNEGSRIKSIRIPAEVLEFFSKYLVS